MSIATLHAIDTDSPYRDLFEHSLDCICIHTLDGRLLSVNPAFVEAVGAASAEELIGTSIRDILTADGDRFYDRYISQLLRDGKAAGLMEVLNRRGEVRMFEYRNTLRTSDGGETVVRGMARDVTTWLRMMQDVRESERRFRVLFERNLAGVALTARGRFLDLNDAALRALRVSREECIGLPVETFWADRDACAEMLDRIERGDGVDGLEVRLRRRDGSELWTMITSSVVERRGDGADLVLSTIIDISDRKALEEQLRAKMRDAERERAYAILRTTVETTGDGMLVVDSNPNALIWNARFLELWNAPAPTDENPLLRIDDVREHCLGQVADRAAYLTMLERTTRFPTATTSDLVEMRDGRILERVVRPLILDDASAGQVISFRDVTEREQRAERERRHRVTLERIAREWTMTFDAVPHPILVLDGDLVIRRVNGAVCALAGRSNADFAGRHISTLGSDDPWFTIGALCAVDQDISIQIAAGSPRRIWDLSISVGRDGAWRVVILRDVTATHELQQSLRRSETMSAMGALVGGVSHQLRNPLFCISAAVDAFEARAGKDGPHRKFIADLREDVARLKSLTNDLLDYGKGRDLRVAQESLVAIARAAADGCRALSEPAQVTIDVEAVGDAIVLMDAELIRQVFDNLLENALQHSPAGSTIRIRVREETRRGTRKVIASIEDEGTGFIPGDLHRVFQPFYTRRTRGTGLGLSIVQKIVEQHDGTVTAANGAIGAIVEIALPAVR